VVGVVGMPRFQRILGSLARQLGSIDRSLWEDQVQLCPLVVVQGLKLKSAFLRAGTVNSSPSR